MYRTVRNLLGGLLLIAIAAGSWWLGRPAPPPEPRAAAAGPPARGYYMEDADITGTDETGAVVYRISAARVEELPGKGQLALTDVRVEYQPAAGVPWRLAAAEGVVPKDRSVLELTGGVRLESVPEEGKRQVAVELEHLTVDADTFVARSDDAVRIAIDGQRLRARGLVAHLKDDRLRLESDIHADVAP
ncbi:MAG TPA: LPS export ABC transporter periplasmic protein LptC [Gammaproteobacteria bacterium]